jgi:hypothetical protein
MPKPDHSSVLLAIGRSAGGAVLILLRPTPVTVAAVSGFSSTFSLATLTVRARSAANSSITGAIIRHGPHQGAQQSSKTGRDDCMTSCSKVASVTSAGSNVTI